MTLLPIIYTSLILFAGLFFFVLVVSYISFKIKSKDLGPRYQQLEIQSPAPIITPVKVAPSRVAVKESYPLDYKKLEKRIQYQTSTSNRYRTEDRVRPVEQKPRQQERSLRVTTRIKENDYFRSSDKTRLEVISTLDKRNVTTYTEAPPVKKFKSTQTLTDGNLLNYYSDRNESGFVSLKAV